MFWFRVAYIMALAVDLIWAIGLVAGIMIMITNGSNQQAMTTDPTMNSTLTSYVFILTFQFLLMGFCLFGFFNAYKIWRNKYMMDHMLRKLFIIWVCCWAVCLLGTLAIAMYALIRGKDPQGQMGYMYEMFQKYAIDPKFVSNFERYQKDHSCCGLYGPDDWLIVQLRASPGGAGGGGGGGFFGASGMDDGFQQNPSTGKCHIYQPLIPPGCGPMIMKDVNQRLGMYAGLTIVQVFLGIVAAVIAWYCFFYWLEKEVIVIPEDEVSNIVVIEPDESGDRMEQRYSDWPEHKRTSDFHPSHHYGSYQQPYHKRADSRYTVNAPGSFTHDSMKFGPASTVPPHHHDTAAGFHHHSTDLPLPPAMLTPSVQHFLHTSTAPVPLHHNSFIENSYSARTHRNSVVSEQHHKDVPKDSEAAVAKQLKTLGGSVLVKMKVDHKLDENHEKEPKTKVRKPTLAIVRNKHKHDPPPEPPPGNHGQTGNLATDIAAMSGGKKILNKIEDLVITDHPEAKTLKPLEPEILGSVSGVGADSALNNLLHKGAATKAKEKELEKRNATGMIKPVVVGTNAHLHGGGGSLLQDLAKKQEKAAEHGGGTEPHGIRTMNYLPLTHHGTVHTPDHDHIVGKLTLTSAADYAYHTQPPATLGSLEVPTYDHRHSIGNGASLTLGSSGIRESLLNAGSFNEYHRHSVINPEDHRGSVFDPQHHRESIRPGESLFNPGHHRESIRPGESLFNPGHHRESIRPGESLFNPGHHRESIRPGESLFNPGHHRESIRPGESLFNPGHHRESIRPGESLFNPGHHHRESIRPGESLFNPDHHRESIRPGESLFNPDHHRESIRPGESLFHPGHHRESIRPGESLFNPGHHRESIRPAESLFNPDHHRESIRPGESLYNPGHHRESIIPEHHHGSIFHVEHHESIRPRDSTFNPEHHRASIYITPHHDSVTSSMVRKGHRPSIYITPKRKHSRLSRIIKHHNERRSRSKASVSPSKQNGRQSFNIPDEDRHHQHFGSIVVPTHDHRHHDIETDRSRHSRHQHDSPTGRFTGRPRSVAPDYSGRRGPHYLDGGHRESRYLETDRHRRSLEDEQERDRYLTGRSRSRAPRPRRPTYDEDDFEYDPPSSRRDYSRSRSEYGRRRTEDNARVLYKNPRKLEDSD